MLDKYKRDFAELLAESGAVKFGDFTLKSGRKSPFFINTGTFDNGRELLGLAKCYAAAIRYNFPRANSKYNLIFGPAYKGISLASATAIAVDELYHDVVRYSSNRKELKDHGDAVDTIGAELRDGDRVIIIDDVLTTGSSIYEAKEFLEAHANIIIVGAIVAIDRHEHGSDPEKLAITEVADTCGFPVAAIATMPEISKYLYETGFINDEYTLMCIDRYYDQYGPVAKAPEPSASTPLPE